MRFPSGPPFFPVYRKVDKMKQAPVDKRNRKVLNVLAKLHDFAVMFLRSSSLRTDVMSIAASVYLRKLHRMTRELSSDLDERVHILILRVESLISRWVTEKKIEEKKVSGNESDLIDLVDSTVNTEGFANKES